MPRLPTTSAAFFRLYQFLVGGAAILSCLPVASGQIPDVHRLEYADFGASRQATVSVHGERLQNAAWLWTEAGLLAPADQHNPASDKLVTFAGPVGDHLRTGLVAARVITETGCSQSLTLVSDSVSITVAAPASESSDSPQELTLPTAVQGVINAIKPRYFRMSLTAGHDVHLQVFARRVNSDLDPVITVFDPDGHEIAFCDDTPGLEGDAELSLNPELDGDYTVELRDVAFEGGGRHFFYMRVAASRLDTALDRNAPCEGEQCFVEQEPNNDSATANTPSSTHRVLRGKLNEPDDVDWYSFRLDQDSPISICPSAPSTSSPVDLILRLHNADGTLIQENDESEISDASICTRLAAGNYFLSVRDLGLRGGDAWHYSLSLSRSGRVETHVSAEQVIVPRGGTASLAARIARREFEGPVKVEIDGLPNGIFSPPVWLHEKQTTLPLTFTAQPEFRNSACNEWTSAGIRILTEAESTPHVVTVVAPPQRKKQDGPFRTLRRTPKFFCVSGPEAEFALTPQLTEVTLVAGSTTELAVQAVRKKDWGMPIDVALAVPAKELPDGISIGALKLEGDSGTLSISASQEAGPTTLTLFLQGSAKKEKTTATYPLPPVRVHVQAQATEP